MTELELEQLKDLRYELNAYARSLHCLREPLNQNPFQVLGRLAALGSVEPVPFCLDDAALLTPVALAQVLRLSERLTDVWYIAREAEGFPWRGSQDERYTPGSTAEYRTRLRSLQSSALEAGQ